MMQQSKRHNNASENSNAGSNQGSQVRARHLFSQGGGGSTSNGGQFNNKSNHNLNNLPYQDSHQVHSSNSHGGTGFGQHGFSMQKVPSKLGGIQLA